MSIAKIRNKRPRTPPEPIAGERSAFSDTMPYPDTETPLLGDPGKRGKFIKLELGLPLSLFPVTPRRA